MRSDTVASVIHCCVVDAHDEHDVTTAIHTFKDYQYSSIIDTSHVCKAWIDGTLCGLERPVGASEVAPRTITILKPPFSFYSQDF